MELVIGVALTIVTLWWAAHMTAWRTVKSPVRLAQGASLPRIYFDTALMGQSILANALGVPCSLGHDAH